MSPCYSGMFSVVVCLILTGNSLILFLKWGWICSTLDCIVLDQHRKTSSKGMLTLSPNVTDLPRSLKIQHVALIISSYPLT